MSLLNRLFGAKTTEPVRPQPQPPDERSLKLSSRLGKSSALVFSDILVTPFLAPRTSDTEQLDSLFKAGHLEDGVYYLAGYPDKGPRALMRIGKTGSLSAYGKDISGDEATEALYFEQRGAGIVPLGSILDVINQPQGTETTVAEVWWFHSSPTADQEWHAFMESFAHQAQSRIFFWPIKPAVRLGPLDFSKPLGSDVVTLTMTLIHAPA